MKKYLFYIFLFFAYTINCQEIEDQTKQKIFIHIEAPNELKTKLNLLVRESFRDKYTFRYSEKMYLFLQKSVFSQEPANNVISDIKQKFNSQNFAFLLLLDVVKKETEYSFSCRIIWIAEEKEDSFFSVEKLSGDSILNTCENFIASFTISNTSSQSYIYILSIFLNLFIIVTIFSYSLYKLITKGNIWIWGCAIQILAFHVLFLQIYYILGKHHFQNALYDPTWYQWLVFTVSHIFRALDIVDFLEEFKIGLHFLKHNSSLCGIAVVSMHLMIDMFFIAIVIKLIDKKLQSIKNWLDKIKKKIKNQIFYIAASLIIFFFSIYTWVVLVESWSVWDIFILWPVDNLLRVIDIGDLFQTFNWKLHNIDSDIIHGFLAIFFRFIAGVYVANWFKKVHLVSLQGAGLTVGELVAHLDNKNLKIVKATIHKFTKIGKEAKVSIIPKLINIVTTYQVEFPIENKLTKEYCFFTEDFYSTEETDLCYLLIEALTNIDPEGEELSKYLQNNDEHVRESTGKLLAALGEKVIPIVMRFLLDNNIYTREQAFSTLQSMTSPPGKWCHTQIYLHELPIMIQCLYSYVPEIKKTALLIIKDSKITSSIAGNVIPIVQQILKEADDEEIKKICGEVIELYKGICFDQNGNYICY